MPSYANLCEGFEYTTASRILNVGATGLPLAIVHAAKLIRLLLLMIIVLLPVAVLLGIRNWQRVAGLVGALPMGAGGFSDIVRRSIDPEPLRSWAIAEIARGTSTGPAGSRNPEQPDCLVSLLQLGEKAGGGIGPFIDVREDRVRVFWGYSFGDGYGVVVGETNLVLQTNGSCIAWVPGMYFMNPLYE